MKWRTVKALLRGTESPSIEEVTEGAKAVWRADPMRGVKRWEDVPGHERDWYRHVAQAVMKAVDRVRADQVRRAEEGS